MPTSADLIAIVAEASGREPASIATLYRRLRETGMIGIGGRGRDAMILRLCDATRVLVAALASGEARDAPERIAALERLKPTAFAMRPTKREHAGYARALPASFFDSLCIRAKARPKSLMAGLDSVMDALAAGTLTPLPPDGEGAEQGARADVRTAAAFASTRDGEEVESADWGLKSRQRLSEPRARLEFRAMRSGPKVEIHEAALSFGRRHVYGVHLLFGAQPRVAARASFGTIIEIRSIGLGVLQRVASGTWDR